MSKTKAELGLEIQNDIKISDWIYRWHRASKLAREYQREFKESENKADIYLLEITEIKMGRDDDAVAEADEELGGEGRYLAMVEHEEEIWRSRANFFKFANQKEAELVHYYMDKIKTLPECQDMNIRGSRWKI